METFLEGLKGLVTAERIQGLFVGIVGTIVIGMYGFWTTDGNARAMAAAQANAAVVETLAPLCVAQAKQDPDIDKRLGVLRSTSSSFDQQKLIAEAGWTAFGDLALPSRQLRDTAVLCRRLLLDEQAI